jgi:hypothetical protein
MDLLMKDQARKAFYAWREECQAIQDEMDKLLHAAFPQSEVEQAQRRKRFEELIRRREAAARQILPRRKMDMFDKDDEGFKAVG